MGLFDSIKDYGKKKLQENRGGLKNFASGEASNAFDSGFDKLFGAEKDHKKQVKAALPKAKQPLPKPVSKKTK